MRQKECIYLVPQLSTSQLCPPNRGTSGITFISHQQQMPNSLSRDPNQSHTILRRTKTPSINRIIRICLPHSYLHKNLVTQHNQYPSITPSYIPFPYSLAFIAANTPLLLLNSQNKTLAFSFLCKSYKTLTATLSQNNEHTPPQTKQRLQKEKHPYL